MDMDVTLEESSTEKIPLLLQEAVKSILSENQTPDSVQKDLLFMVIVVLMIENGFLLIDEKFEIIEHMDSLNMMQLTKWKLPTGICETTFVLKGFKEITIKLLMSPLGATVLVNLVINEFNFETYSTCLPVSRYVVSPQASSVPMIFRDLKHFSVTFKNKLLSAVKSRILSHHGYASGSLIGLPEEVLIKIMLNIPVKDVLSVCKTCNRLKVLLDSQSLWYSLNRRDFPNNSVMGVTNWKDVYKKNYMLQQEKTLRSRQRRSGSMHDYMEYADYVSYIDNPMWNAIV